MLARRSFLLAALLLAMASGPLVKAQLVGGKEKAPTDTPEVKRAAQYAMTTLNNANSAQCSALQNGKTGELTLLNVQKVSTQVVAGLNYHMTLEVKDAAGKQFELDTTVWYRAWMDNQNSLIPSEPAYELTHCGLSTGTSA